MNQAEFEKKVIEMLVTGNDLVLENLRYQYHNSVIESRKFTGAGFFTHFKVKDGTPPAANGKNFQIGDIVVTLNGIKEAIGVILFVENGYLTFLEGYTLVSDAWPNDYSNIILEYDGKEGQRNLEALKTKWTK